MVRSKVNCMMSMLVGRVGKTVMRMAIISNVVNGVFRHLYNPTYGTDIGAHTHNKSLIFSFTDQTYLVGHSTTFTDSLLVPITRAGSTCEESSAMSAAGRHTFLGIALFRQTRPLRYTQEGSRLA